MLPSASVLTACRPAIRRAVGGDVELGDPCRSSSIRLAASRRPGSCRRSDCGRRSVRLPALPVGLEFRGRAEDRGGCRRRTAVDRCIPPVRRPGPGRASPSCPGRGSRSVSPDRDPGRSVAEAGVAERAVAEGEGAEPACRRRRAATRTEPSTGCRWPGCRRSVVLQLLGTRFGDIGVEAEVRSGRRLPGNRAVTGASRGAGRRRAAVAGA